MDTQPQQHTSSQQSSDTSSDTSSAYAPVLYWHTAEAARVATLLDARLGFNAYGPISAEAQARARDELYAHVSVGCFEQHFTGERNDGYYQLVAAYDASGRKVYSERIRGTLRYEPETLNRLGVPGAYRDVAPDDYEVECAVRRAQRALRRAETR